MEGVSKENVRVLLLGDFEGWECGKKEWSVREEEPKAEHGTHSLGTATP